MFKFLLPLMAALKAGRNANRDGWELGVEIAQAYKGCMAELKRPMPGD